VRDIKRFFLFLATNSPENFALANERGLTGTRNRADKSQERSNSVKSIYKDRTADLGKELDAIHAQNVLFWKRGASNSREAKVQHQLRLNRVDEIMKELVSVAEERRTAQPRLACPAGRPEFSGIRKSLG
jgi:hypothetical protein